MKKLSLTLLFATVAGALTLGAAASLPVSSQQLGSGGTAVTSCDPDGVSVTYTFAPNEPQLVRTLNVEGIDPACTGQTLYWNVSDASSAVLLGGSGTVTGAVDQSFDLSSDIETQAIAEVSVTIVG